MAARRILVVEGNTRTASAELARFGVRPYGESYAAVLRELSPGVECTVVDPCERGPECLPTNASLDAFDGVVWTGSALNVYDVNDAIRNQLALADKVLKAGMPVFGSCWGLQVFATALGGKVRKSPKGREIGIARGITLTEAGRAHPMYADKPSPFEALAVHMDDVERLPEGAVVLATNAMSDVQAMAYERNGVSFWGVQYHPEFNFATIAAAYRRNAARLVKEGICPSEATATQIAEDLARLESVDGTNGATSTNCRATRGVLDPTLRRQELLNWFGSLANS